MWPTSVTEIESLAATKLFQRRWMVVFGTELDSRHHTELPSRRGMETNTQVTSVVMENNISMEERQLLFVDKWMEGVQERKQRLILYSEVEEKGTECEILDNKMEQKERTRSKDFWQNSEIRTGQKSSKDPIANWEPASPKTHLQKAKRLQHCHAHQNEYLSWSSFRQRRLGFLSKRFKHTKADHQFWAFKATAWYSTSWAPSLQKQTHFWDLRHALNTSTWNTSSDETVKTGKVKRSPGEMPLVTCF